MKTKQTNQLRLIIALVYISIGIITLIFGTGAEKICAFPVLLFALYPLSKIGFEDRYKV